MQDYNDLFDFFPGLWPKRSQQKRTESWSKSTAFCTCHWYIIFIREDTYLVDDWMTTAPCGCSCKMQFIMPICRSTLLRCRHAVAIQGMPQLIWFKPVGRGCMRRAMNGYFEDDDFEERHCSSPSRRYQSARYPIRCYILSFYPNNPEHMLNHAESLSWTINVRKREFKHKCNQLQS